MSVFPQWFHDMNAVFGLVGFGITLFVMFQVREIKRAFRSKAQLPDLIKELQKAGSTLNNNLEDWPTRKNDARTQIKVAAILVHSALRLLPAEERKRVEETQAKLAGSAKAFGEMRYDDPNAVWDLYSDIQSVITSLNQSVRNRIWE